MRRLFLFAYASDRWLRQRFTPVGRLFLGALIAVGLFALNPRASSAYELAVLMFAVLICALAWAPLFRPRVDVERRLSGYATQGENFGYQVVIHNRGRHPLLGASLRERVSLRGLHRRLPGGGLRGGYRAYVRALRHAQGFHGERVDVPGLAPGEQVVVTLRFEPQRRGYVDLPELLLERPDPLGVFRSWCRIPRKDRVLCLPKRHRVAALPRRGRARLAQSGASVSKASGDGLDFARLREYRPGDPLRHVDWRAWARLGEPVVKEFHDDAPARSALLLDTAVDPQRADGVFEAAVSVAASFAVDPQWRGEQVELLFAGDALLRVARGREREGVTRMLECLACVTPAPVEHFAQISTLVRRMLGQFESCVCVLTDLDPEREAMLDAMASGGADVWVMCLRQDDAPPRVRVTAEGVRVLDLGVEQVPLELARLPQAFAAGSAGG